MLWVAVLRDEAVVLKSRERGNGVCGVNWKESMDWLVDGGAEVLEVCLRAFWCKARGGGGRLRHATER